MNDGTRQCMGSTGNAPDDPLNQRPAIDREESAVRLFLSYAGVDRAYARTVAEALEATPGIELSIELKEGENPFRGLKPYDRNDARFFSAASRTLLNC